VAAGYGFLDVNGHLRAAVGSQIVDLALDTVSPCQKPTPAV
jgi:hypothetical protein